MDITYNFKNGQMQIISADAADGYTVMEKSNKWVRYEHSC